MASVEADPEASALPAWAQPSPPRPFPAPVPRGPSPATVGVAAFVVLAIVARVAYLVVGKGDDGERLTTSGADPASTATTVPGQSTAFSALWAVDGYDLFEADPSVAAEARAARDELGPSMRGAFRDTQVKKVDLDGRPLAYVVAHTLDPIVTGDTAFTDPLMFGMKQALTDRTDTTVEGTPAVYGQYGNFVGFITIKNDVLLFVIGQSRSTIEPLLAELLRNIT